jgi:hypothetical protein
MSCRCPSERSRKDLAEPSYFVDAWQRARLASVEAQPLVLIRVLVGANV